VKQFLIWLLILTFSGTAFAGNGKSCRFDSDFSKGKKHGFQAVFRDLPFSIYSEFKKRERLGLPLGPTAPIPEDDTSGADETHWRLQSGIFPLPDGLPGFGYLVQGTNHSDDLDMYLVRRFGPDQGFRPNSNYKVQVTVDLAGDAPRNAIGIGGDPELHVQAVLATGFVPTRFKVDSEDWVRHLMPLESFPRTLVATNGVCDASEEATTDRCDLQSRIPFELKKGKPSSVLQVRTDSSGRFWLMVGSHSGFEGFTGIYYTRIQMRVLQGPGFHCSMRPIPGAE